MFGPPATSFVGIRGRDFENSLGTCGEIRRPADRRLAMARFKKDAQGSQAIRKPGSQENDNPKTASFALAGSFHNLAGTRQ